MVYPHCLPFLIIIFFLYLVPLVTEDAGAAEQANCLNSLREGHRIKLHHCHHGKNEKDDEANHDKRYDDTHVANSTTSGCSILS
jgi:hypothetical protein